MTDVFVVGGGPAGLAAAIAARLKGFDVTLADAARPPIDKACGEGLLPDASTALDHLGIRPAARQCFPLHGVRCLGDGVSVEAAFPDRYGTGVRRLELHHLLLNRATELGTHLLWGVRVMGASGNTVSLDSGSVRCRWIIGADGQNSRVRQWTQLQAARHDTFRFGFRRHYQLSPWTDLIEIYWGDGCEIYVTPVSPREVCIALLASDPHARLDTALPQFPELARRLAGAPFTSTERGAVTASRRLRRVYRGQTALIGDASGSVDAITGEGLALSLHQSIALADALAHNDLASYQAEHRRLERRPVMMANLMLMLDRHAWLRRRVLRAMAAEPSIFANLVAMHVGSLSSADFVFHGMLPLGRQILVS